VDAEPHIGSPDSPAKWVSGTIPHERELLAICDMAMRAYTSKDSNYLGLVLTDSMQHANFLANKFRNTILWDKDNVRIHREGIEFENGGRILIRSYHSPSLLMGLQPTEVVLFGRMGELFYHLETFKSFGCEVRATA
jgi:hypothetical protein